MSQDTRGADEAQEQLLASFPFIALGLVAFALATLQFSISRLNRAQLNLWIACGAAFLASLFQLARVILSKQQSNPLVAPGLFIGQGIALGFFVNFKLFFLFRRVREPILRDSPIALPLADLPRPVTKFTLVRDALLRLVRPGVWVLILSTGFVDSTWRIGVSRSVKAFTKVYLGSNALQLILQTAFVIALLYIFALETVIVDHRRHHRDSFSFDRLASGSSSSDGAGRDKPPALSRSPLDRARGATVFSSFAGTNSVHSRELTLSPSSSLTASIGAGIHVRRASNQPSWLPFVRSPTDELQPEGIEYIAERNSLILDAAPPARPGTPLPVVVDGPQRSLLLIQQSLRAPETAGSVLSRSTLAPPESFPESVRGSCPNEAGRTRQDENERIVFATPTPSTPSSEQYARPSRPALTINTAAASPSKPLPSLPPAADPPSAERTSAPTPAATASTSNTLSSLFRLLPTPLQNPTRPLDLPKPHAGFDAHQRDSDPASLASTARSSAVGDAVQLDSFPYPPSTALLRTSSGRMGTASALGRVRSRDGSEFDLVPPKAPFMSAQALSLDVAAAGSTHARSSSSSTSETTSTLRPTGGGVDVTSLIVGTDDASALQDRLDDADAESAPPAHPAAAVVHPSHERLPSRPSAPIPPAPRPARTQPPRPWPPVSAAPGAAHTRIPSLSSVGSNAAPTYPPPAVPGPESILAARRPSAVALAAAQIRAEQQRGVAPPPTAEASGGSRIPRLSTSRVGVAVSTPGAISVPSPPPFSSSTGEPAAGRAAALSPGSRIRRFVFPLSTVGTRLAERDAAPKAGAEKEQQRIVLDPETAFEAPRRVPTIKGERYSPKKEEGEAEAKEGGGEQGEKEG
ncbi:hypothetical protein JCM10207_005240 [Rhodosporidiobolus poonsookiae]